MGRPQKYIDPGVLEAKCNEYFEVCDKHTKPVMSGRGKNAMVIQQPDPEPYTVPGLAHHLGFESRQSILNYKAKPKLMGTIKKALNSIEAQRVKKALRGQHNPVFSIFDLKNNFGYKDKQETEISGPGGGPIAITAYPPEPEALAQWEVMMITARKAKQLPEKT